MAAPAAATETCPGETVSTSVVDWGYNLTEQLVVGFKDGSEGIPQPVLGVSHVTQVSSAFEYGLGVTDSCHVIGWGQNRSGELGDGNRLKTHVPHETVTESGLLNEVREVSAGGAHAMALRYDGTVWTWGTSDMGERGNGESGWERQALQSEPTVAKPRTEAIEVAAVREYAESRSTHVTQVAAGGKHDYAVLADGEVLGWGEDNGNVLGVEWEGQKCIGELHASTPFPCVKTPKPLTWLGEHEIERVAAGEDATYGVVRGGKEVLAWGKNSNGELGNGTTEDSSTPVRVAFTPSSPIVGLSAEGDFVLALLANGTVYGWGVDNGGQIGIEPGGEPFACKTFCVTEPELIPGLDHVVAVAGGYISSLAIKEELGGERTIYSFGHNGKYELLGLGIEADTFVATTATAIPGLPSARSISVSSTSAVAAVEGEPPARALEVTPGPRELHVTWHVAGEGFKLRYRPVGTREFSKSEPVPGCNLKPECESFTFTEVNPEPLEVEFSTTEVHEGKTITLKTRKQVAVPEPASGAPRNTAAPTITASTGPFHVEQELTAHTGSWSPAATSYEYKWFDCDGFGAEGSEEHYGSECEPAPGSSNWPKYTAPASLLGDTVVLEIKATNGSGWSVADTEPELLLGAEEEEAPLAPENVTRPKLLGGAPLIGETIEVESGTWEPESAVTRVLDRWFLCKGQVEDPEQEEANGTGGSCHEVTSGKTYKPEEPSGSEETPQERVKNSPIGKWVEVQEHATDAGGGGERTSLAKQILPSGPPENLVAPEVEGTVEKGQTLKIVEAEHEGAWPNAAHWTNAPENPTYQWYRCTSTCAAIESATKPNYKIQTADVGYKLELQEKVENRYGAGKEVGHGSAYSAQTIEVPAIGAKPEATALPKLSGTAKQGATLTVERGTWVHATTITLNWKRCNSEGSSCEGIGPAKESSTYTLQSADVGKTIRVSEHAVSSGGSVTELSEKTATVTPVPPANVKAPTIKGTAQQGHTLSETHGEWTNSPTSYAYQWQRCNSAGASCAAISGATGAEYVVAEADVGGTIRVAETASNGETSSPATSLQTALVKPSPPSNTEAPSITGASPPQKGEALTAQHGAWTPTPTSYSYKWQRCNGSGEACAAIEGATASTYTPVAADVGHALAVEVRASNEGGWDHATSAATSAVATPTPSVSSVSPPHGPLAGGGTITISGSHLGDATSVHFGSAAASEVHGVSESSVTAIAPAGSGVVDVTVTTPYGTSATSSADEFTYVESPSISGVSPLKGPTEGGTKVIVTGAHFSEASAVDFGLTAATSYVVLSSTEIEAVAPAGSGTVDVGVTSPFGTSPAVSADHFTYVPAPSVTAVSPSAGVTAGGNTVTITGEALGEASAVHFGSASGTGIEQISSTTIKVKAPSGSAGTVDVTVTTPFGTSATGSGDHYTYVAPPAVSEVSPSAGPLAGGNTVTITGTSFGGATSVHFGASAATGVEVVSSTTIKAKAPSGSAGTVDVTVTTPYGTSSTGSADHYTYMAAPTVTNVNPNKIPITGEAVTIEGTGFVAGATVQAGSEGSFSSATSVTVVSSTVITATMPARAPETADVIVTTPGGSSSTSAKDHMNYAPEVTSVTPATGPKAGGTTVTLKGVGFTTGKVESAKFGGFGNGTSLSCSSTTECTVKSPAGSGKVDVQVSVNGSLSFKGGGDHFTYE